MKVAFLGDSITEGIPGVSFVNLIIDKHDDYEIINYGRGGDTVSSLYRRIKKIKDLRSTDVFVLFVGVNDVYSKLTRKYKVLKFLRRQVWARNAAEFEKQYAKLLNFVSAFNKKIIVVSPSLIGEDVSNKWNQQLLLYTKIIEQLCTNYDSISYIDIRTKFIDKLEDKEVSQFLPFSLYDVVQDVVTLDTPEKVDDKSVERGLHVTLDGIHINSKGATIIAEEITKQLHKLK